jgi:hypothetical protein
MVGSFHETAKWPDPKGASSVSQTPIRARPPSASKLPIRARRKRKFPPRATMPNPAWPWDLTGVESPKREAPAQRPVAIDSPSEESTFRRKEREQQIEARELRLTHARDWVRVRKFAGILTLAATATTVCAFCVTVVALLVVLIVSLLGGHPQDGWFLKDLGLIRLGTHAPLGWTLRGVLAVIAARA